MVEPTESEDLRGTRQVLDDAMIAIRAEIDEVGSGAVAIGDSVLRNAPHTAQCLVDEWDRPYPRRTAVFPRAPTPKYWPPTRRIDNAFGDRNLHCTCAPVSDYS